jgi:hypothetical protein
MHVYADIKVPLCSVLQASADASVQLVLQEGEVSKYAV